MSGYARREAGQNVQCRTATGEWLDGITTSGIEPQFFDGKKRHDFVGVWVKFTTRGRAEFWPVDDVRDDEGGTL